MNDRKLAIETITNVIDRILDGNYKIHIDINSQSGFAQIGEKINTLSDDLQSSFSAIKKIARGDFSSQVVGIRGIAAGLKTVQANFRHLIWQSKEIATGDFSQKMLPLGELSESFNKMAKDLMEARATIDERTQQLENAKEQLQIYSLTLEQKVEKRTTELKQKNVDFQRLFINTIQGLSNTLEAKDKYTKDHSTNVGNYAALIAEKLNFSKNEIESLRTAAYLHDIGKIGIKETILNKPGSLIKEEYAHIKSHPLISVSILDPIRELGDIIDSIRHHHERFDGSGYPDCLKGEDIPVGARILAIADAYDAMSSDRPYRKRFEKDKFVSELIVNKGIQFDPRLVDIFIRLIA